MYSDDPGTAGDEEKLLTKVVLDSVEKYEDEEFGITQIVISENEELEKKAAELTTECTVCVEGTVVERQSKNDKMPTGDIEVIANSLTVLGKCKNILSNGCVKKLSQEHINQIEKANYQILKYHILVKIFFQ